MSGGTRSASLALENHRGVCRLVTNTWLAQKRWAAAEKVPSAADVEDWAMSVPVDTLKRFFVGDHYGVDELEALVEIQLRASA